MAQSKSLEERLLRLKQQHETAQREAQQAEGVFDQLSKELRETYGCANTQEAENVLEQWDKELEQLEAQLEKALDKAEGALA